MKRHRRAVVRPINPVPYLIWLGVAAMFYYFLFVA